jgi:hypothetical protein
MLRGRSALSGNSVSFVVADLEDHRGWSEAVAEL